MNGDNPEVKSLPEVKKIKVYGTRWVVLAIFVMYSASNAFHWTMFSIIADVITEYYGISMAWVDWTTMIYFLLYIPFVFPASYLLEKLGLRKIVLIGMVGTCAGTWLKLGAVSPDRFWLAFLGQSIVAFCQVFVLSVPSRLAAVWFGPAQVSSACSIGVFGNQLGIALGFILPPLLVPAGKSTDETTYSLYVLNGSASVILTLILLLVLFFFKDAPPTPPSHAVAQQDSTEFVISLKNLLKDKSFMLLFSAYGISTGVFYAISTLLNQIILHYYPNGNEDAGRIGLVIIVAGMIGSVCCGVILDRYHKFKETILTVYALALMGMVLFTFTVSTGLYVVYITSFLLGFFMTGLLPIGFELAAELTYPEPEGTSSGLLNLSASVCGIIFTNLYSVIFYQVDAMWANISMCLMLFVGTVLLACTSSNLKRQAAQTKKNGVP